jgi:nicotinate-nucleotide--dimethylbenzimidazole phosphoribosyltransferase
MTPWWTAAIHPIDTAAESAALARQSQLTKPAGSLGRMEDIAVRLAALQGRAHPAADRVSICIFAGDHGVVAENVSAFPQAVTQQMMLNFTRGGAAISVLARHLQAGLRVINVGTLAAEGSVPGVIDRIAAAGTRNFCEQPAMTHAELADALQAGRDEARLAAEAGADLLVGGEMGIGNTTAATAILSALLKLAPAEVAGPGTGLDPEGVHRKAHVVARALELHADHLDSPLDILRCLGGFEIAALTGFYLEGALQRKAVLVDGFICTAAALLALRLNPGVKDALFFSHCSAEPGFRSVLSALPTPPLLDLGLRLGEGSGAALCVPLLRAACALHNGMATFAEAAVSTAGSEDAP